MDPTWIGRFCDETAGLYPICRSLGGPRRCQARGPERVLLVSGAVGPGSVNPAAPAAAPAPAAESQPSGDNWLTGSIELGYRWVPDVGGTDNAYRSVVNLTDGFRILNSDFTILDPHHRLFDRADVHTSNWGDPYTTLRVNIEKHDWYNLTASYRNIAYFDFIPSFANPQFNQGSLLDQNSFDTAIRATDIQLDLLPHKWITPYLGFSRNTQYGRGVTDFNQESQYNEYPVASLYSDQTSNYRAGVRMEMGKYHVTLEQGGTTFKDDQGASQLGANPGNRTSLLFGQTMPLDSMDELYRVRGDSIYSKALIAANPLPWVSITGDFVYARPRTDVNYTENSTGNFFLQRTLQFYSTGQDLLTGDANMPHLTGNLSVELRPTRRLRIVESWMSDRFHGASNALLVQNLLAGMPLTDQQLANERIVLRYNQEEADVYYDLTSYLTLRGGYRFVWGNSDVTAPILTGIPSETANLHRQVGIAGVSYRLGQKLRINGDAEGSSSTQAFFRTSLQQYEKAHIRAQYDLSAAWHFAADVSLLNNSNPDPERASWIFRARWNRHRSTGSRTPANGAACWWTTRVSPSARTSFIWFPRACRPRLPSTARTIICSPRWLRSGGCRWAARCSWAPAASPRNTISRSRGSRCRCTNTYSGSRSGVGIRCRMSSMRWTASAAIRLRAACASTARLGELKRKPPARLPGPAGGSKQLLDNA